MGLVSRVSKCSLFDIKGKSIEPSDKRSWLSIGLSLSLALSLPVRRSSSLFSFLKAGMEIFVQSLPVLIYIYILSDLTFKSGKIKEKNY